MNPARLPLRHRLLLTVLLPVTLLVAAMAGLFLHRGERMTQDAIVERGLAIVSFFAPAAEYGVISGNAGILDGLLQALATQPDVAAVALYERGGELIASHGQPQLLDPARVKSARQPSRLEQRDGRKGFAAPGELQFFGSWGASLCYALQLYFDFSGYSDMALGLAKMFGIRFPLNFNSPYKAGNIIEFWARWHMTLTRYLTAYLYYPVAMAVSRYRTQRNLPVGTQGVSSLGGFAATIVLPTAFTMGLAGIWHGAGLQFLIFGLLHGIYLSVNHAWRQFGPKRKQPATGIVRAGYVLLTFLCVVFALLFFRAHSTADALLLVRGMLGLSGVEPLATITYPLQALAAGQAEWTAGDLARLFFERWGQGAISTPAGGVSL